tara:strand:- start:183 stop:362 length:180 start_codon:yes stop_codon:yes gene_type:complete
MFEGWFGERKTPTGKDYTRQLIGMYFYESRKIKRRLKHSELKLTNIRFWVSNKLNIIPL